MPAETSSRISAAVLVRIEFRRASARTKGTRTGRAGCDKCRPAVIVEEIYGGSNKTCIMQDQFCHGLGLNQCMTKLILEN